MSVRTDMVMCYGIGLAPNGRFQTRLVRRTIRLGPVRGQRWRTLRRRLRAGTVVLGYTVVARGLDGLSIVDSRRICG